MKNKIINNLFGEELINAMKDLLNKFVGLDYDEQILLKDLKGINESVRMGLYLMALENGEDQIAFKLNRVNKMLNADRKKDFLDAFEKGETDKFLAMLGKSDKISLMDDLGVNVDVKERASLSKIQKKYYEVISNSIFTDQSLDARDGIDRFIKYKKEA